MTESMTESDIRKVYCQVVEEALSDLLTKIDVSTWDDVNKALVRRRDQMIRREAKKEQEP